jgi:hypothetical protein
MLTKQSTQLFNQLESLLYSANPEILKYCQEGMPGWVMNLLKQYPTAAKLGKARATSVARIPYISTNRARDLVAGAKTSIASATDAITGQLICATVGQIQHLQQTIKAQTKILATECNLPEVKLLKTFTGIGDYSAIGLMLEIQAVERFSSVKKLASFFGLHPVYKVSGDGRSAVRMSKKGRKEPRAILFMVAMSAIGSNSLIRDLYQKHVAKGMEKMAAIGLCMHKILRIGNVEKERPIVRKAENCPPFYGNDSFGKLNHKQKTTRRAIWELPHSAKVSPLILIVNLRCI